ncbi:hypothetical protein [Mesorhizobium sp. M7A.F.Ca.US.008.03.1.1]|uniref:hypothetical protein n=1 Tax=Mesorhizobium sp. M7A.F.Ca.US.008.03.1.1 TaxID=2496742 RepID=UPI001FE044A3|nr:hypothetical protein [Mesorhizobium sp. M7A.F.Ca.US.008.03.1.1]
MHPAGGVDDCGDSSHRQNDGALTSAHESPGEGLTIHCPASCPNSALQREKPMRMLLRTLFLGLAAASLSPAWATASDCGDAAALVQQAYPKARKSADGASFTLEPHTSIALTHSDYDPPGLVCKIWPAHDNLMLVAVPLIDSAQSVEGQHVGDIELLVVDRKSLQVRQRLLQPGLMSDDAIAIRGIEFDTGRYGLAPKVTAFGLRIDMANHSQVNPFSQTGLRLYALDGDALRMVLDGLVVAGNGGEGDSNCAGSFHSSQVSLAMSRASHHGYHDITAVERIDTDEPSVDKDGECQSHPGKSVTRTYRLRYDGSRYPVPEPLKALGPP